MEQIANVQQTTAATQTSLRKLLGMDQAGQMGGDGFAAIFEQLMGGDLEDGDLAAMLMQMTGGLQKDSEELGAQMAAEMLNTMPFLSSNVIYALVQASWSGEDSRLATFVEGLEAQRGNTRIPVEAGEEAKLFPEEGEETAATENVTDGNKAFVEMLAEAWKPQTQTARAVTTGVDHDAIRAAKELMAKNGRNAKAEPETLDVESLQADVNARRFMPTVSTAAQSPLPQVPTGEELAQQVKTGILENAAKGKNEFVVRLKPEGIGEIVVKLSENKEKISLSIITSNPQTARLISNEVAALQNALKPLNAEVQEITTVAGSEQAAQYSAQGQMTDQGRQSHRQDTPQSHRRGVMGISAEESFEDAVEAGNVVGDDALDTYI